jgi:hypothetical protein
VSPYVADRLALTEQQRNEAARIVNVQALAVSNAIADKAPAERFLEIYKEAEDKLSNLLTSTQKAVLAEGLERKEIRIVARNMPWKDALELIAMQGGYQLIMDAPPPGT